MHSHYHRFHENCLYLKLWMEKRFFLNLILSAFTSSLWCSLTIRIFVQSWQFVRLDIFSWLSIGAILLSCILEDKRDRATIIIGAKFIEKLFRTFVCHLKCWNWMISFYIHKIKNFINLSKLLKCQEHIQLWNWRHFNFITSFELSQYSNIVFLAQIH